MAKTERKPLTFEEDQEPPAAAATPVLPKTPTPLKESPAKEQRQQVGARVPSSTYRRLKARAALQGVTVGVLVEQAITEFLTNHAD